MARSSTEFYDWLFRVTALIRAQKDPQEWELFDLFIRELHGVLPFDEIAKFDGASNTIRWYGRSGFERLNEELEKVYAQKVDNGTAESETLCGWVYAHQETIILENLDEETRFPDTIRHMRQAGMQSVCAIPLSDPHRRLGSIVIASVRRDAYSPDDVRFGTLAANHIALAMDDALNFRASERARVRLALLLDLNNRVVSKLNLREVLREISANIRRVMECDGVAITLPNPEVHKLCVYTLEFPGHSGDIGEGFEMPAGKETSAATVFQTGEPVILSRDQLEREPLWKLLAIESLAHVPLKGESGIVGVLTLGTRREGAFAAEDFPFLHQIARQLAIALENALAFGKVTNLKNEATQEKLYLEDEIRSELHFGEIVFKSDSLRHILEQVETVAPTDSTVLIYGETGTGKELIARAVHDLSHRRSNAFVKVNCAAIPVGLLESELFGHERGAFTGAVSSRVGRFELASHGTLFLDEIGELPLDLQPKLLRVLQEHEFERLGSTRTLHNDARLIAATNRDLKAVVKEGKFRSDLYYRLEVFPLRIPTLRERPEDIPLLVRHYVQQFSSRLGKTIDTIPPETMDMLVRYPWPGNVRELQNVLERASILTSGPVLSISGEDLSMPCGAPLSPHLVQTSQSHKRTELDEAEEKRILAALEEANWIVAGPKGAAARLGIKRSTLQSRMQKLGIHILRRGA
jgi:formate hydrogenlyase transcriptional activator